MSGQAGWCRDADNSGAYAVERGAVAKLLLEGFVGDRSIQTVNPAQRIYNGHSQ